MKIRRIFLLLFVLPVFLILHSCKVENLLEKTAGEYDEQLIADSLIDKAYTHVLEPDDKINLSIWDHDELSVGSIYSIYNANEVYGRWLLIDEDGYATLPRLGKIKLSGLTLSQAEKYLAGMYGKFLKYPIIEIQLLNNDVTVLGEVLHPGRYTFNKERPSIIEVLAEAGGFDFYADKKHVKLIRHSADTSYQYVLDLTSMPPYFDQNLNIHSGDFIYVPAKNAKKTDKRVSVIIPFTAIISSAILILTFIKQN